MVTPRESRAALLLLTLEAVQTAGEALRRFTGRPEQRRAALLDTVPEIVNYYADGSAALAADFYEEQRDEAGGATSFVPELIVADTTVKVRRGVAWASDPLFAEEPDELAAADRLAQVVQIRTATPYRQTILDAYRADDYCIGWRRITRGGCRFCRMLADRGAVYKETTAIFASHPNCNCTAQPVFRNQDPGEEASALQYMSSRRNRTPESRARIRDALDRLYPLENE